MPTEEQIKEAKRLKAYFPYRIVFIAVAPDGAHEVGAMKSMSRPNSLARKGYKVFVIK